MFSDYGWYAWRRDVFAEELLKGTITLVEIKEVELSEVALVEITLEHCGNVHTIIV